MNLTIAPIHSHVTSKRSYFSPLSEGVKEASKLPYKSDGNPLESSFLEELVQKNILDKNHGTQRGETIALQVLWMIDILPDEQKKKFFKIVEALNSDKENLKLIKGASFSGGEIRVVAECGPAIIISAISELLGITYSLENKKPTFSNFSGTSAGSYIASSFAARCPISSIYQTSSQTDFKTFYHSPEIVEKWANKFLRLGYYMGTGKKEATILFKHLEEMGSNFQALVGTKNKTPFALPTVRILPKELNSVFGIEPENFEVKKIIQATSNLPFLFYPFWHLFTTCGDCILKGPKAEKALFDPGMFQKYMLPLDFQREEIDQYKKGLTEKPGYYFIVGNKMPLINERPKTLFGAPTPKLNYFIYSKFIALTDLVDKWILGTPRQEIKKTGLDRTYLEASCEVSDASGHPIKLGLGGFDISVKDREVLIIENIKIAVDQLYKNIVETPTGKNWYETFVDDIRSKNPLV